MEMGTGRLMLEKRAYHDSCFVNSRNRQARIVDVALDSRLSSIGRSNSPGPPDPRAEGEG